MDGKKFIMLHDASLSKDGKYEIITFILNASHILGIKENINSSGYSLENIVDDDKAKISENILGKCPCEIITDYLDDNGKPKVFRAIESCSYIYEQL